MTLSCKKVDDYILVDTIGFLELILETYDE